LIVLALAFLLDPVENAVVRQNDVCAPGDADLGIETLVAERVEFVEQRARIHHTPVPEHPGLPADRPARDERELVRLSLVDDGVSGVVAALVPGDDICGFAVQVDDPAFSFVSELCTDDCDRHQPPLPATGVNRFRSRPGARSERKSNLSWTALLIG